jgi:hypothetical protein
MSTRRLDSTALLIWCQLLYLYLPRNSRICYIAMFHPKKISIKCNNETTMWCLGSLAGAQHNDIVVWKFQLMG